MDCEVIRVRADNRHGPGVSSVGGAVPLVEGLASMRRIVRWPTSRYTLAGLSLAYKGQEEQTFIQNHGAAAGFCFI